MNSGEERSSVRDRVTQQDFSVLGHIGDSQGELHLGVWIPAAQGDNVRISGLLWPLAKRKHTQTGGGDCPSKLPGRIQDRFCCGFLPRSSLETLSAVPQCSHQIPCLTISAKPPSPEHISQALPQRFQIEFPAAHDSGPCHFLGFALFSPERGTFNRVTRCGTQKFTPSTEAKALCFP